jgi:hypothetical protein
MKIEDQIRLQIEKIVQTTDQIAIPYLKELEGSTKQRIHNKGLDSDGKQIGLNNKRAGRYSPGYEKRKRDGGKINGKNYAGSGQDVYPINLQVHGDLLRSFTVGTESGTPVLRFQDQENSNKAAYAEKNYNTDIYRPTTDQLADNEEVLRDLVKDFLRNVFS